jgi:MSHA biogenesis protein MshG
MSLVANAVGNSYFKKHVLDMQRSVEQGDTLTVAARKSTLFTPLVIEMIGVGEETGALQSMLDEIAEYYEREVDYDLARLSDSLEPILLIILGGLVLFVALAIFLPMWNMVSFAQKK